jgi:tetratricopeptide (TPR) repeat protein
LCYGCAVFQESPGNEKISLYEKYRTQAMELEKKDEFIIALYYWKIADILAADNRKTDIYISSLQKRIEREAEEHFRKGIDFYANNMPDQAFDEFLTAVRYDLDHKEALRYLRYIQSGKNYAEIQGNKIPEGLPVLMGKVKKQQEDVSAAVQENDNNKKNIVEYVPETKKIIHDSRVTEPQENEDDRLIKVRAGLLKAKTCFNNKDYDKTILITSRILEDDPGNREALNLRNASYFSKGNSLQSKNKYTVALKMFRNVEPGYKDVNTKISALKKKIIQKADFYYKKGVRLFVDEKLKDAIIQWDKALELNPEHKEAQKSIEKAYNLLEKLKKVK